MSKDELLLSIRKIRAWNWKDKIWKDGRKAWIVKCIKWVLIGLVVLAAFGAGFFTLRKRYFTVEVDSRVVLTVDDKTRIEDMVQEITAKEEAATGLKLINISNIKYNEVMALGNKLTPEDNIEDVLKESLKFKAEAYCINVDGKDVAILKDESTAESILSRVKDEYVKNNDEAENETISFRENVQIVQKTVDISSVQDEDEVFDMLTECTEESRIYVVEKGDTVSEIAERFKIKQSEIEKMNPGMDVDRIQIGQEIILSVPRYTINIESRGTKTYEESIPYEVEYEKTDSLYEGQSKVKVEGKEGKKSVTVEVIKINGIVSEEKVLSETIIEEPQNKVVLSGTKKRPSTMAYGEFIKPSRGSITSAFGQRWGKLHTGIDIGVDTGTEVKAADGGKVIFAGWKGNYGKLVIIDHENGYTTYYGHCSKLKVSAGQRVARGEVIALSGATGNVTGPHLHFEVRKNGVPQNPLKYLNY